MRKTSKDFKQSDILRISESLRFPRASIGIILKLFLDSAGSGISIESAKECLEKCRMSPRVFNAAIPILIYSGVVESKGKNGKYCANIKKIEEMILNSRKKESDFSELLKRSEKLEMILNYVNQKTIFKKNDSEDYADGFETAIENVRILASNEVDI